VAFLLEGASEGDDDLYVMINAWTGPIDFVIQSPGEWRRAVDTDLPSPNDVAEDLVGEPLPSLTYRVGSRSVVVLTRPRD
jgi:glycogen operon protein